MWFKIYCKVIRIHIVSIGTMTIFLNRIYILLIKGSIFYMIIKSLSFLGGVGRGKQHPTFWCGFGWWHCKSSVAPIYIAPQPRGKKEGKSGDGSLNWSMLYWIYALLIVNSLFWMSNPIYHTVTALKELLYLIGLRYSPISKVYTIFCLWKFWLRVCIHNKILAVNN